MHYIHFGKPADVFKHINLCEILIKEKPEVYVETNSAYASYDLQKTPEQQCGIYYFLEKAKKHPLLQHSVYYIQENEAMSTNTYLGSPALAMNILGKNVDCFYFFDIESAPLTDIQYYATQNQLSSYIKTFNQDSIQGTIDLLPSLPINTLLHIDPYLINQPGSHGYTYLDVFTKATNMGLKCILWYGFNNLNEKKILNHYMFEQLANNKAKSIYGIEWIMNTIQQNSSCLNPGVAGNGLLVSNLSSQSIQMISEYTSLLESIYKGIHYKQQDGGYYSMEIIKKLVSPFPS